MVGFVNTLAAVAALASIATAAVSGRNNVVLYWGQGYNQKSLRYFCGNGNADIINIGFMDLFPEQGNGYGGTNFGNQCWDPAVNDGEYAYQGPGWEGNLDRSKNRLLKVCPDLAGDIQFCQSKGVKILLSLGGATQFYQLNKQGPQFALQLWRMFGPKPDRPEFADYPRPFDPRGVENPDGLMPPTVVDGFDMDIEHKSLDGDVEYVKFLTVLRSLMDSDKSRDYILSAAPQCIINGDPMQNMINKVKFDLINVQFYNTPQCSAKNWIEKNPGAYPNKKEIDSSAFTFNAWATELKRGASADAKLTIGLMGGEPAGNKAHYLNTDDMKSLIDAYFCKEKFAGIMLWDATYADNNQVRFSPYQRHVRDYLNGKALCAGDPPRTTKSLTSSTIGSTSTTSSSTSSWITVTTTSSSVTSSDISTSSSSSSSSISSTSSADPSATSTASSGTSLTSSSSSSSTTISRTSTSTSSPIPIQTVLPGGLITSPDGSCGNKYSCQGFPSLTGYSCCNQWGRCGDTASDCAIGCKSSHSTPEKCAVAQPSSSTSTSATPSPTALPGGLVTSPDGSCGNKYSCQGFPSLTGYSCCNKYGRCGDSADDCTGCKESHSTPGKCNVSPPPPTSTVLPGGLVTSPDGSCGNKYSCQGFASLTGYSCCNKYGRCGSSADDCTGCKESHSTPGKCNAVVTPAPSPTALPGGLVTSPDGSCGNKYSCQGFPSLTGYSCCNKYGRCGDSAADCGVGSGCKESHSTPGKCNVTPVASPLPAGLTTSPDGSCGNKYSCQNFAGLAYACCNQYGRCGNSAADCGTGCKSTHSTPGKCSSGQPTTMATSIRSTPTANPSGLITSPDGSCGNKYTCNGFASPFGYSCCNKYGRCGSSAADCGVGSGCKETHSTTGKCGVASGPVPTSAPPAKANLVRSPNGTCGNSYTCAGYASPLGYSCCNRYGNCGSSADDCGAGCKKGYGACF